MKEQRADAADERRKRLAAELSRLRKQWNHWHKRVQDLDRRLLEEEGVAARLEIHQGLHEATRMRSQSQRLVEQVEEQLGELNASAPESDGQQETRSMQMATALVSTAATAGEDEPPPAAAAGRLAVSHEQQLPPRLDGIELELNVRCKPRRDCKGFVVTALDRDRQINHQEFPYVPFLKAPAQYFADFYKDLEDMIIWGGTSEAKLKDFGAELARQLPQGLNELLWASAGRVRTLLIQTDEPQFPWELVRLQSRQGESVTGGPYLCDAFEAARWMHQKPVRLKLGLGSIAAVIPRDSNLEKAQEEFRFLETLRTHGISVERIPAKQDEVRKALASGRYDGWHFSGHGRASDDPNRSQFFLEGGESMTPRILAGEGANMGRGHPLVFLNACQTGRRGFSLTGAGGWAESFLQEGAGAFIGTHWLVSDSHALRFAQVFYERFLAGVAIAESVHAAREAIKEPAGNPSWLAYTLYAHPDAVCEPAPRASESRQGKRLSKAAAKPKRPAAEPKGEEQVFFNGVNEETGSYWLPPISHKEFCEKARLAPIDLELLRKLKSRSEQYGIEAGDPWRLPVQGIDPLDLSQAGWGVIFAQGLDPEVESSLSALLDHRRESVDNGRTCYFKELKYQPGEGKADFLRRYEAADSGPANPEAMPYFLLLVGDPLQIPYRFQYEMDVQYAVGRICFQTPAEYFDYARSVVEAERLPCRRPRQMAFFGVKNPDDKATFRTTEELVRPLAARMTGYKGWQSRRFLEAEAVRPQLERLIGGDQTPGLLFTASHGVRFAPRHSRLLDYQGALLCQEWEGPKRQPRVRREHYFTAEDVVETADLHGLIAFHVACYSAGCPSRDSFSDNPFGRPTKIAPHDFVARLPQRLLGHPNGGALAVVGHIDRGWTSSFSFSGNGGRVDVYESTLKRLVDGHPIGSAMEFFNQRYAELGSELVNLWQDWEALTEVSDSHFSRIWRSCNDARNFIVLGDPAVRLPGLSLD